MNKIFITICAIVLSVSAFADNNQKFALSIHAGTDLGAAVPWPISNLTSRGDKFKGTPKPYPTVGLRTAYSFSKKWAVAAEVNYKRIVMDAKTRVTNQCFNDAANNARQYFTGTARAHMDFRMLEVPIYAKFTFKGKKHSVLLGVYGSYDHNPEFESIAEKGFVGTEPNVYGGTIDADFEMSFTPYLDNWEIGGIAGYQYQINQRLDVGARLYLGFKDIFQKDKKYLDYKMVPVRGSFLLSCRLF